MDPDRPWDRELTEEELAEARRDWPDVSERRQRHYMKMRLRARYLHSIPHPDDPTRRCLGGAQPNSGAKKQKLGEALVEYAEREQTQKRVRDAFDAGLTARDDPALRVKTAVALARAVRDEDVLTMRREEIQRDVDKTPLDEVKRMLTEGLLRQIDRGDITPTDLMGMFGVKVEQPAIPGTAEDVTD